MDKQHYDVVIVGGGLVGMSCALALHQIGLKVALIESRAITNSQPNDDVWDSRIYAITPANVQWLKALGVWQYVDEQRICAIDQMHVFGDAETSKLVFDASEANKDDLGVIVESNQVEAALMHAVSGADIRMLVGKSPTAVDFSSHQARLHWNGLEISADLLVAADGANSWLRSQAGIAVMQHDYEQMGVVANFALERSHQGVAYQWFGDHGVLAWLPLPRDRMSMVWSTDAVSAARLTAMSSEELCAEVANQGDMILGQLKLITAAQTFPLREQTTQSLVLPSLALIGDAAHTIHPLAGQGVNLGFRDVQRLAETLAQKHSMQSCGDVMLLRRYERARKTDMMAMKSVTRGLSELFAHSNPAVRQIRNWGLNLTNRQSLVKKALMHHAMK